MQVDKIQLHCTLVPVMHISLELEPVMHTDTVISY